MCLKKFGLGHEMSNVEGPEIVILNYFKKTFSCASKIRI